MLEDRFRNKPSVAVGKRVPTGAKSGCVRKKYDDARLRLVLVALGAISSYVADKRHESQGRRRTRGTRGGRTARDRRAHINTGRAPVVRCRRRLIEV